MGDRRNRGCGRVAALKGCETSARIAWLNGCDGRYSFGHRVLASLGNRADRALLSHERLGLVLSSMPSPRDRTKTSVDRRPSGLGDYSRQAHVNIGSQVVPGN